MFMCKLTFIPGHYTLIARIFDHWRNPGRIYLLIVLTSIIIVGRGILLHIVFCLRKQTIKYSYVYRIHFVHKLHVVSKAG